MTFNKKLSLLLIVLSIYLTIAMVSATDNATDIMSLDEQASLDTINENQITDEIDNNESSQIIEQAHSKVNTKISSKDITTYYKETSELVSYLKDNDNQPISNKKVSLIINNKVYNKLTDNQGKIVLKINLKPNTYKATIKFDGDENYTASTANAIVKVKKSTLTIKSQKTLLKMLK